MQKWDNSLMTDLRFFLGDSDQKNYFSVSKNVKIYNILEDILKIYVF